MLSQEQIEKLDHLRALLRNAGSVAVAFSGGVDSTLLLAVAHEQLGGNVLAITNDTTLIPKREFSEAEEFCKARGIRHEIMKSDELALPGFKDNPPNRCYLCKKDLFTRIVDFASENGISYVAEGSNVDDGADFRPGFAAVQELGVASPLLESSLTKQDIRDISKEMGLPTWNKQSFACLASRFPYGSEITAERLSRVDKAEQLLIDMGVSYSRVRDHGDLARIEVLEGDFDLIMQCRGEIVERFRQIGFAYTALDLSGYRTGSMNETLGDEER